MKSFVGEITDAFDSDYGNALLYATAIGLVLSDIIPTPADAVYYHREKKLRSMLDEGKITPEKYYKKSANAHYIYTPIWWALVLGILYKTEGGVQEKAKIGLMVVGVGAAIGLLHKSYSKDIKEVKSALKTEEPSVNFDAKPRQGQIRKVYRAGNKIKFVY